MILLKQHDMIECTSTRGPARNTFSSPKTRHLRSERLATVAAVHSRLRAFLRFSPAVAPGAAPRLTAFAALTTAPTLISGVTLESEVPRGGDDT